MDYLDLARFYQELEKTKKRLKKTSLIASLLKKAPKEDLEMILLLIQGKIFHPWDETKLGIAQRLVMKAISQATGISEKKIEEKWKTAGDLGLAAEELKGSSRQTSLFSSSLSVRKVYSNCANLARFSGQGTVDKKLALITELLISAKPLEARYIVRTVLEDLRVGVGKGSIRDAIIWAFIEGYDDIYNTDENKLVFDEGMRESYNRVAEKVQDAYDMTTDFAKVALFLIEKGIKGLEEIRLNTGSPINLMLYRKASGIADAFDTVGRPAAFEYKYDGFRLQISKDKDTVKLFTRRLEDVTAQFPEVVKAILENVKADSCILDAEAVGYDSKTGKYLPFQSVSQRIRRKYDIDVMAERFPVELDIFDILLLDGKSLLKMPFIRRRELVEKIVIQKPFSIVLAKQLITSDEAEAERFYQEALDAGQEGIMAKKMDAYYKPGARVGYGMKIKPVMEPLDLFIIGAEWGEGKRKGWLTSFDVACWDETKEDLLAIGKFSTGLKELDEEGTSFAMITKKLEPLIIASEGKKVSIRPEVIVEILYEEIQKSPSYSSGFALRFPRFSRLRDDKSSEEVNSIIEIENLYLMQRGRDNHQ